MISFFDTITDMREMIKRNLNLKYLIPFIANEAIIVLSTLSVIIFLKNENYSLVELTSTIIMMIFIFFFFRKDFNKDKLKVDKETFRLIIKYTVIIFSLNIITTSIENLLSTLLNVSLDTTNQGMIIEMLYYNPFSISVSVILAGIIEEMLYRYSIFRIFKNRKVAFFISWLMFAFGHFSGFNLAAYISMISYLTLSFALTYIYYKYDDIRIVCGVHLLNNTIGIIEMMVLMFM